MRIASTKYMLPFPPLLLIAYGFTVSQHVHVAGPIIILFFQGLSTIWVYSSLLAYIVDSNPGQSSSAVACNSLLRGVLAAVASQVAEPAIDAIKDQFFYLSECPSPINLPLAHLYPA